MFQSFRLTSNASKTEKMSHRACGTVRHLTRCDGPNYDDLCLFFERKYAKSSPKESPKSRKQKVTGTYGAAKV